MSVSEVPGVDAVTASSVRPVVAIDALMQARSLVLLAGWIGFIGCAVVAAMLFTEGGAAHFSAEAFAFGLAGALSLIGALVVAALARGLAALLYQLSAAAGRQPHAPPSHAGSTS